MELHLVLPVDSCERLYVVLPEHAVKQSRCRVMLLCYSIFPSTLRYGLMDVLQQ